MKTKTRFAWKQFLKNLAIIAIPVALQNMLTTTGSMIDTMLIAPLGETTVGAVGLCAQFSSLMFAGYWAFSAAACCFSRSIGEALDEVDFHLLLIPAEMLFKVEQIRVLLRTRQNQNDQNVDNRRQGCCQRRAAHAHLR